MSPDHTRSQPISTSPPHSHIHTFVIPHWHPDTPFSHNTLSSTTPLRHLWFCMPNYHTLFHSLIVMHAHCTHLPPQTDTLLISPIITHTNTLTLYHFHHVPIFYHHITFSPFYPLSTSSNYYLKCPTHISTFPHFQIHNDLSVWLSSCPFPLFSLPPYSFMQSSTGIILITHSWTCTVSLTTIITYILILSRHYHSHCPSLHFQWFHAILHHYSHRPHCHHDHTDLAYITPSFPLSLNTCPTLLQTHSPDQPQFYTPCPSPQSSSLSLFFPFTSLLLHPPTHIFSHYVAITWT